MAAIVNSRDVLLQAAGTRLLPVILPSNVTYNGSTSGNHTGQLSGQGQSNFKNASITFTNVGALLGAGGGSLTSLNFVGGNFSGDAGGTFGGTSLNGIRNSSVSLSANGMLNGAGGGQITNLDYGNVSGTKPPASATTNFFSTSGSNPFGGVDGNAHWNSSTQTMWFKTGGVWRIGGTVNAGHITTGTLAAARLASNSVTTDKLDVGGALSNITSNLGFVTSGSISTSGTIRATGTTAQSGSTYSAVFNANGASARGIYCWNGVVGIAGSSEGVLGQATSTGGVGVSCSGSGGAVALEAFGAVNLFGSITMNTQTISNLTAGNANNASNANSLGGVGASGWCRGINTDSGQANASGFGFGLTSTVSGVRTRAFGGNNVVIETISDRRIKTDISPEKLGLHFINQLKPVRYRFKENPRLRHHGFIAQDVEKIIGIGNDALAHTHDDGMKGVDYMSMVSVLVHAIQELNDKIEGVMHEKQVA